MPWFANDIHAEILADIGFADSALLRPVVETWEHLIAAVDPSIILADFSPSVCIASRGRIPIVVTGNGWTIPPDGSPIPKLPICPYDATAATDAEKRICGAVHDVARASGGVDRFAYLLRGNSAFVYTFPLLDPYRDSRRDMLFWPTNLDLPQGATLSKNGQAVVYLPPGHPAARCVLDALGTAGIEARAYFGGAQLAAPSNVTVQLHPLNLAQVLPSARVAIHHGGLGIASWCLAYQVPQVILPVDLEKGLIAHAVQSARAGVSISTRDTHSFAGALDRAIALAPQNPDFTRLATVNPDATVQAVLDACRALM